MRALVIWRDDYLREKATGKISSRPSSPISDEEDVVKDESAPQQEPSTSSSWVQWWKRSRRTKNDGRPELNNVASSPAGDVVRESPNLDCSLLNILEIRTQSQTYPPSRLCTCSAFHSNSAACSRNHTLVNECF